MKILRQFKTILPAVMLLFAGSFAMAQNAEADKEKQRAMEAEQKAQMERMEQDRKREFEEQQKKMKKLEQEYAEQADRFERQARESSRWSTPMTTGIAIPDGGFLIDWGQENQTQLTIRKNFRGTTNTSKGKFDVDSGVRRLRCMINGSVRTGEIKITVEYPNGKTFKELTINSSADINFSQSISIEESEENKYVGSWSYTIKAEDAEGNYLLQISTN
jgi:hypothetical protein